MLKSLPLIAVLLASQVAATALASNWTGDTDTDWFNAANWSAGVPTSGINADFNDPDPAIIAGAADANRVYMTDGSLTISSGSLTAANLSQIGLGAANPTLIQDGGDVAWNGGGLYVGNSVGSGADIYSYNGGTFTAAQLTVRADGQFDQNNSAAPVISTSTVQIGSTAGNTIFNLNGNELRVGTTFTFGLGNNTVAPTFNFGDVSTAKLTFTGATSALRVQGTSNFVIPAALANGITTTGQSIIGSGDGYAQITQNGGDVAFSGGGLFVGSNADGKTDQYNFNGGTFSAGQLTVREAGEFNHNNSGVALDVGGFTLGSSVTSNAVFNLNGNHLNINGTFNIGTDNNTGTNAFNFGNPTTAQLTFTGASQFNIKGNNSFIVPAGLANPITFPGQSIVGLGDGNSLYQQDGGTVNFTSTFYIASSTNTGGAVDRVVLNDGELNFSNTINLRGRGVLTVNGGTLNAAALPIGLYAGFVSGYESTGGVSNFSQTMTVDSVGDSEVDFIHISGGTVNINGSGNDLVLNGTSTATITGGTTNIADDFLIGTKASHIGTVNHSGGRVNVADELDLATVTGSTGTYNLNGGELNVEGILNLNANDGADTFNFSSGKLSATTLQLGDGTFNYTGGFLSPGLAGSPATMTVNGDLNMPTAGGLNVDLAQAGVLGGLNDLLQVNGDLNLNGTLTINDAGNLANGVYPLITFTGSLSGLGLETNSSFRVLSTVLNGGGGGTIYLTVVPEPSSLLLLGCGLFGIALRRRKRNR